jgi:abequosyltransferase
MTCANIKYHLLSERGGIDRDMARVVALASGCYCWLFSGDDLMREGAIDRVLQLIRTESDVYLCRHTMCTIEMAVLSERDVLAAPAEVTFDLQDEREKAIYCQKAITTEAFFSFLGGIVVKTSKWGSVGLNDAYIGSCWAHVARLFELMPNGLTVTYVPEVLLDRRGDNDSFADRGVVNRYRIAVEGYHRIAEDFLGGGSRLAFHVRRVLRNEFGLRMFLYANLRCYLDPERESRTLLTRLIRQTYCDAPIHGALIELVCRVMPGKVYCWLRNTYRGVRSWQQRFQACRRL